MAARPPIAAFLPLVAAAAALAGCMTPHAKPVESQAVKDALAHKDIAPAATCPDLASPFSVGFPFQDSTLKDVPPEVLDALTRGLACHAGLQVEIAGGADAHGTAEEQAKLAGDRAQAVAGYLTAHGVAASRVQILPPPPAKPPAGDAQHLVVMAEGRRW